MLRRGNKAAFYCSQWAKPVLKEQEHLPLHTTHLQSQPGEKVVFFHRCFSLDTITLLLQKRNVITLFTQAKLPA